MPVHKLVDAGGGKYLPFALSKLRYLVKEAEQGSGYAHQRISTDDGFSISVSVTGKIQRVEIRSTGAKYEFFASDHILRENATGDPIYFASPGYTLMEQPAAHVIGSLVEKRGSSKRAVYSQVLTPPLTDGGLPKWRAADPLEGLYVDPPWPENPTNAARGWPVSWGAWQLQKAFEYITWPSNGKLSLVSSTQAMSPGRNVQCNDLSAYKFFRLANYDAFISDYGFDVPPAFVDARGKQVAAPDTGSPFVWWRHAAVQNGHMIATDNVGNFYVYPIQEYEAGGGGTAGVPWELPPDKFKKYTPAYPAWVTLPTVGTFVALTNAWLWAFDKNGTRAVSCPLHSEVSFFYKSTYITSVGARLPGQPGGVPVGWIPGREDIPGLVEFGIVVTPSATADPMDFTVAFTLLRENYSGTGGGRYIFDAAYSLPDVNKSMNVPEDTLVTSEIEVFTTAAEGYSAAATENYILAGIPTNVDVIQKIGPWKAEYVMNAYVGADNMTSPTEKQRITMYQTGNRMYFLTDVSWAQVGYPSVGIFTDQMAPTEKAVAPYSTFKLGYLHMIELRTMSIGYTLDNFDTQFSFSKIIAYTQEIVAAEGSFGTPGTPVVPDYSVRVPASATYVHGYALDNSLDTVWGSGFNIHPAGHWSCSRGRGIVAFDIIKEFKKPITTHMAVFNAAFNQSRDHTFYAGYSNAAGTAFDPAFVPGSPRWDLGSFRTNGVWITF